jgi:transposase InsO family protein
LALGVSSSGFHAWLTRKPSQRTGDDARAELLDYIDRFYDSTRRHSAIGYLVPVAFERLASSG